MSLDAVRAEAARVAAHVDLRDVRVWKLESELANVPDDRFERLSFAFNVDLQVQHNPGDEVLLVLGNYSLAVRAHHGDGDESAADADPEDTEDDELSEVASIAFQLNALFEVERQPEDEPFTESELTAYGQTTGAFALYPYARELIADLTGRMGLPALHVPVMRLSLESREG